MLSTGMVSILEVVIHVPCLNICSSSFIVGLKVIIILS